LGICLGTSYFQLEDKFYLQADGRAKSSWLSPAVSNVCTEHFEEKALDTGDHAHFT
jgi:hypothetical protein